MHLHNRNSVFLVFLIDWRGGGGGGKEVYFKSHKSYDIINL